MRFSTKISILLATLIIISGIIQFLSFDRIFSATTNSLLSATSQRASQNIGENLAAYFSRIRDILKTIALDPAIKTDPALLDKLNSLVPEINMLFVVDAQGNLLNSTGKAFNLNIESREYFTRALQGQTYVSNVFFSAANRQVVAIATPIKEHGQITGVLVASVWLHNNYLTSMFDNKVFGRNGYSMITDAQGTIVYHQDKSRIGTHAEIFGLLQEPSGTLTVSGEAGKEQYIGYTKIPGSNWLVVLHTPTAELKELRRVMIYQVIAVSLLTICLLLVIGIYTLRRYMQPFEQLAQAFRSISKGKYHKLTLTNHADEFDEFVQDYNLTVKKLEDLHNALRGAADIEGLTGTYNRRAFDQTLLSLRSELQSGSLKQLAIIFIDLDNLKVINDTQGHLVGDDVLRNFAAITRTIIEPHALFRYGGDEFVIILRDLPRHTIIALAEKIRSSCEQNLPGCTTSIGLATYPDNAASIDELLTFADKALYISKREKNTVTAYD